MPRWQRWTTYLTLAACATTGFVWFLELDVWDATPSTARPWWIAHGVTAVFAAFVIGGALVQHVVVTWRAARGRWTGAFNVALLGCLVATALYLMYGAEVGHDTIHWIHAIVGITAIFAFAGHVLWGRTRVPRLPARSRT
jgi:hypothetical protein